MLRFAERIRNWPRDGILLLSEMNRPSLTPEGHGEIPRPPQLPQGRNVALRHTACREIAAAEDIARHERENRADRDFHMAMRLPSIAAVVLLTTFATLHSADPAPPKGFRAIFNGKDLSGWHGLNPHSVVKLEGEKREAALKQQRAEFAEHWRVENGELVNVGTTSIDIGGWYLSDAANDLAKFRIPRNTVIPAGGYIVFTESIYYSADCAQLLRRYTGFLNPNGVFIISICQTKRSDRIWADIHSVTTTLDTLATRDGADTWDCQVLKPQGRA